MLSIHTQEFVFEDFNVAEYISKARSVKPKFSLESADAVRTVYDKFFKKYKNLRLLDCLIKVYFNK